MLSQVRHWVTPFSSKTAPYDFLPLAGSRPTSPDGSLGPSDKGFGPRRASSKRAALWSLWGYVSPVLVLVLVLALGYKRRREEAVIMDPYVCRPKGIYSSLEAICEDGAKKPVTPSEVEAYELGLDRSLTQDQCDDIFPGLYHEADRARDFYLAKGGIELADLDAAEVKGQGRAMIYNNRLYVKSFADEQQGTRTKAALAAINEALITSLEPVPDIEFVLQTGDSGIDAGAPWVLGRQVEEEQLVLMPDYGFFSWPEPGVGSFLEVQDKTLQYERTATWKEKLPQLFWRGALLVPIRREFIEIAKKYQWGAVTEFDWQDRDSVTSHLLTPEQHCQYKFLGHVEGWGYSGRLKYLQQCRSVVVAHNMKYIQHFHHLFNSDPDSADQNIVIVPSPNFDRLPETMQALLDDDARAEHIANNSFAFYRRWLSPASVNCYWRRLFVRWREAQKFEPVLLRNTTSYESFILLGKTHWDPY